MKTWEKLLQQNKAWAAEKLGQDPKFFERLSTDQKPTFLWIGCSDSRVPANEVTNTDPGEMFVHRNIANVVVHTDLNLMSVLQYSVQNLGVKHIIVCGHYGCGGVKEAMTNSSLGLIDNWLRNIKDVYHLHREELDSIRDDKKRLDRLVELNVYEQCLHIAQTAIVQQSWKKNQLPHIHGWVYNIEDGILKEEFHLEPDSPMDPIFRYDF